MIKREALLTLAFGAAKESFAPARFFGLRSESSPESRLDR